MVSADALMRRGSPESDGCDPLHPAAPRLRSQLPDGCDLLHPAAPRLRSQLADR
jgi:hypothetical protein